MKSSTRNWGYWKESSCWVPLQLTDEQLIDVTFSEESIYWFIIVAWQSLNHNKVHTLFTGLLICWLCSCRKGNNPNKGVSWIWLSTASDGEAPVLKTWGEWCTTSLKLSPGPLRPRSENYLYSIGLCAKRTTTKNT